MDSSSRLELRALASSELSRLTERPVRVRREVDGEQVHARAGDLLDRALKP
jgi:hypothetical protein